MQRTSRVCVCVCVCDSGKPLVSDLVSSLLSIGERSVHPSYIWADIYCILGGYKK